MQTVVRESGINFEVEFDFDGNVDAIYIGGTEVSDIISAEVGDAIYATVERNHKAWVDEYMRDIAAEEREARRAA